jgi:hypothetical protein
MSRTPAPGAAFRSRIEWYGGYTVEAGAVAHYVPDQAC